MSSPAASFDSSVSSTRNGKRIALVIHALYGGGAERLMSQLANRWTEAGHDVHLVTLARVATDNYSIVRGVQRHGLDLMQPSRGWLAGVRANWQRVRQLRRVLAELSPEFILSFCDRMNITTISAARELGKPLWIAEHSDPSRQYLGLFWETWRQWSYRRLARDPRGGCVVLTDDIAQKLRIRFPGLKLVVIPPATALHYCTNTTIHQSQREGAAVEVGDSAPAFQLLSMGRHSPEKNLVALLQAWQKIYAQFPKWRLVLVGDGPQHQELVGLAHQLRISDSVQFAGWVNDPWPHYRRSALLAMTSHYEGVPVAMLEAMSAGLPCVSTPCASTVKEFAQAGAVQLAASTSPTDLAQALSVVMADGALRQNMSSRGLELVQRFGWETIGPRWDELLNNID